MRFAITVFSIFLCSTLSALAAEDVQVPSVKIVMDDSLTFAGQAPSFSLGELGSWQINSVASALAYSQSNPSGGAGDISNAQLHFQKVDGDVGFSMLTGLYSVPVLGKPIVRT